MSAINPNRAQYSVYEQRNSMFSMSLTVFEVFQRLFQGGASMSMKDSTLLQDTLAKCSVLTL